jgi:predicted glycogen debranching enzyme
MIQFTQEECRNIDFGRSREWLLTNGIGGYASSSILGMNTRRYHGLLVAATKPPLGRMVLLSHADETLIIDGVAHELSTNRYDGGVIHPRGHSYMTRFEFDVYAVFTWGNGQWELKKSIFMVPGQNTVIIDYLLSSAPARSACSLEVRPLIAFRDFHGTTHENESLDQAVEVQDGVVSIAPYSGLPRLFFAHSPAVLSEDQYWYRHFDYELERERGFDSAEDLFSPFTFRLELEPARRFTLIVSAEAKSSSLVAKRDHARPAGKPQIHARSWTNSSPSLLLPALYEAAEQFIVARPPFKTIIAGYHWFGDWGRDTMIALPGLLLATNQSEVAREILQQFVRLADEGMLPNRFPDTGEQPEYNTVDATLWFFDAIRQYVSYRDNKAWKAEALAFLKRELYEPLKEMIRFHLQGTRYGIHADDHGFLWAGDSRTQLTWMDAKVGDIAITPRHGRPVEIQALWHNALQIMKCFATKLGDRPTAETYSIIANSLRERFEDVFWNEEKGCLYDVAGNGGNEASVRPNQIFAISLHHPLLSGQRARRVLQKVESELLTPFGLRTLSPQDRNYKGRYEGGVWSRDSAYHQGSVWPWLAGPFFAAKLAVSESKDKTLTQLASWLSAFESHLREAGIGQISEIFDGDPPHAPRGCIAQAWSVAEILRLAKLTTGDRDLQTVLPGK